MWCWPRPSEPYARVMQHIYGNRRNDTDVISFATTTTTPVPVPVPCYSRRPFYVPKFQRSGTPGPTAPVSWLTAHIPPTVMAIRWAVLGVKCAARWFEIEDHEFGTTKWSLNVTTFLRQAGPVVRGGCCSMSSITGPPSSAQSQYIHRKTVELFPLRATWQPSCTPPLCTGSPSTVAIAILSGHNDL